MRPRWCLRCGLGLGALAGEGLPACPFNLLPFNSTRKSQDRWAPKFTQHVFYGQESVMSIIPDQFPGIVSEPKKTCSFPLQVVGSSNSKRFEVWVWVWWGQAGSVANGRWMIQKYTNTGETMLSFVCYIYYQRMSSKHCEFHFFDMLPGKKNISPPQKRFQFDGLF